MGVILDLQIEAAKLTMEYTNATQLGSVLYIGHIYVCEHSHALNTHLHVTYLYKYLHSKGHGDQLKQLTESNDHTACTST